jgi:alcohol dehydrogenase class IV
MTPVYGLTSGQRKRTGKSPKVLPKTVIYDPELTVSLPPSISGPSAMNAIAHCVETFYAPGTNPIASLMAEEGIRTLASGVPTAVSDPENLDGRTETLYGAYLAGAAFASTGGGIHHKICHVLGGAYGLPHAESHGPDGTRFGHRRSRVRATRLGEEDRGPDRPQGDRNERRRAGRGRGPGPRGGSEGQPAPGR